MWWKKEEMLHLRSSAFVLLLILQWAAVSQAHTCQTASKCDFVCDCEDCSDEWDCGYRGKAFECDFEDAAMCGWTSMSLDAEYTWERRQRGDTLPVSGPSSDFTTGTATGWFMGVSAVNTPHLSTAVLISPEMQQSAPTCRLRLRYFMWDSDRKGLGAAPLWASVLHPSNLETKVWRPEATSVRGWREDTIFLGRISTLFRVKIYSQRSKGLRGDVAIDQMEFLDCDLPSPISVGMECPAGAMECNREGCVELRDVCDLTDNCGDRTDEDSCGDYYRCDFEDEGLCGWDLRSVSDLKWVRACQETISLNDPLKGPGRDHTNNTVSGHFLYVTVPDGGLKMDWASFQSPLLEPANSSYPCKMVMYTHQFGPRSGGLTVLVADKTIYPVWERAGALGDVWVKAEVEIVTDSHFHIVIMAAIRDEAYGGIAVDSIVLSPECRISEENYTMAAFPPSPQAPCTTPDKLCNFNSDCPESEDEAKCGDFSYASGSSGWTDISIGNQAWDLFKNSTSKEEYLYVYKAPGQQLTEAQTRTPLLGPSGPACTLSFDYALTGNPAHIGELSVQVIDSWLGKQPKLWEFSGKTGKVEGVWEHAEVVIGARKNRFQLLFEARAKKLCPCAKIRVQNVRFVDCHAEYLPSSPTKLSCNFEEGLCGWYQDNSDNFDWTMLKGNDHTVGTGTSLTVNMWNPSLRGVFGRLFSYPQAPSTTEYCLTFFYKLYGPNTGVLNVKLLDKNGFESVLWTRRGAHGNIWHEAQCPVPQQLTKFQLMFEAVRSGFDGQVAIDDIAFAAKPCSVPSVCSFEGQRCGFTSSGQVRWRHGNARTVPGPKNDHTLETDLGFYMMVNTGADILPSGVTSVLSSPLRHGTAKTECVHFWYHMGGVDPGYLTVYVKMVNGKRVKIFSNSLDQGDVWRHGNGNISTGLVDWQLEFQVVGAGGKNTHVAVDDIFLASHACENRGSMCNMERGFCTWSNTQDIKMDQLDWELTSHKAEKHYFTPTEDHTLGTETGHFLFFPSSNRTAMNTNAELLSPHLPPTIGTCLRFWAYRSSTSDCKLNLWRLSGGLHEQLAVLNELGGAWQRYDINIVSPKEYQIVFEGIKGTTGSVALDDIEYTVGVNCDTQVTEGGQTSQGDDTGGLAASIIIVLLLIGTLVGVLVYYLRYREGMASTVPLQSSPSSPGGRGFSNEGYESDLTQDHVAVPEVQNHPMEAGFININNVYETPADMKELEVA